MCFGKARVIFCMSIVLIENESCVGTLIFKYSALCVNVILKVPVLIKMVRRQVRYHRNVRSAFHAVQLEGAELQHGDVVRVDIRCFAEERVADVPAEVDSVPRGLEEFRYDRRGRSLAVAAGYGYSSARAQRHEHLHLGGHDSAARFCFFKVLVKRHEPGRSEYNVLIEMLKIILTETKLRAHSLELLALFAHFLHGTFIAGGHMAAVLQQQLNKRLIADAYAYDRDPFIF